MKHALLRFVPGAAVPIGYGVLVSGAGWQATQTDSDSPHPAGVGETFVWHGELREQPGAAISDCWIHATGSQPV